MRKPNWKELQSHRDWATQQGESCAQVFEFNDYPIDPFDIIRQEHALYAEGANLGDAMDGQLKYVGKSKRGYDRFLLAYNTRYNTEWNHEGNFHPKVRFTVAHELGHYFMDKHRNYLRQGGQAYSCFTESYSNMVMELEADAFAAGLLMPSLLLKPIVNRDYGEEPTLNDILKVSNQFQISLTSMMVRWTKLSDFPCAVFSVARQNGKLGIRWGWVSEAFANVGAYWRRFGEFRSQSARKFLGAKPNLLQFQTGHGLGMMNDWVETDHRISVTEHYAVIPYAQHLLVFLTAPEEELANCNRRNWDY